MLLVIGLLMGMSVLAFSPAQAVEETVNLGPLKIASGLGDDQDAVALSLKIFVLLTALSLVPAALIMFTSFARIVVVLSFLRQALGIPQLPPNPIVIGLSLFLTFYVMSPVWGKVNANAIQPYLSEEISAEEAITEGLGPLREFMFRQTHKRDLSLFLRMNGGKVPASMEEVPTRALVPAFMISELKTAFQIGFLLYVPFLILDMVVASVLLSMGMMFLPPVMISLPMKLLLFVLVDGWVLVIGSLVQSFG
jgi:flagellar biosynthetic protein FliP